MDEALREKARRLASRSYLVAIQRDESTEGQPLFVALHPELPNCFAQGETIEEALAELSEAREEYIASLLEDGLEVPEPETVRTITGSVVNTLSEHMVFVYSALTDSVAHPAKENREERTADTLGEVLVRA